MSDDEIRELVRVVLQASTVEMHRGCFSECVSMGRAVEPVREWLARRVDEAQIDREIAFMEEVGMVEREDAPPEKQSPIKPGTRRFASVREMVESWGLSLAEPVAPTDYKSLERAQDWAEWKAAYDALPPEKQRWLWEMHPVKLQAISPIPSASKIINGPEPHPLRGLFDLVSQLPPGDPSAQIPL